MLQTSNLSFYYQDQPILQNVNFSFAPPETVAIIGNNGAGKTTLLRLIAGEITPDEGSVRTHGSVGFLHQSQDFDERSMTFNDKSGGEQTQLRLAELLRQNPDILLLDEPTNNLDRENRRWLIEQLRRFRGLALVVSHDRDFIDQVADKILYVNDSTTQTFTGNYTAFRLRQEQLQHEQSMAYDKAQHEKRKLQQQLKVAHDHVHKTERRAFNKARDESKLLTNVRRSEAQKSAGKMLCATTSKLSQLNEVAKPFQRKTYTSQLRNNFTHTRVLLEVNNLSKSYGAKLLFDNLSFIMRTGNRFRVSGRNGTGKSTLFKIILGEVAPDFGQVNFAQNTEVAYISQNINNIDLQMSFLEQNPNYDKTAIHQAASTMNLTIQDIGQPAHTLSRGQLTKLAILRLILQPIDLVILDEITNHLDIRARENIEQALKNYPGAILMATHDEKFAQEVGFDHDISLGPQQKTVTSL